MNTMSIPMPDTSALTRRQPRQPEPAPIPAQSGNWEAGQGQSKVLRLSVIVGLHVVVGVLLQSGMLHHAVEAIVPKPVEVTFVASPTPPPPAPPPKTVPVMQPAPAVVPPPLPQLNVVVENTISVPPPQPRTNPEPAPAQVSAPPAPPAPPTPPAPAVPRTVQGVEYIKPPAPAYPNMSRRLGETGVVMLRVLINERGLPEQVQVHKSSGHANLDEAGRQAALKTLFKPYKEDGKAIPVYALVPINFQLS